MKKNLLSLSLLIVSAFTFAQTSRTPSFQILDTNNVNLTGTIVTVQIAANNMYVEDFKIKNLTGANINYRVDRIYLTPPVCSGNDIYFCAAGVCLPPDTAVIQQSPQDVILANQTLPSGVGSFGIQADYVVGPTCCSEDVMYKVVNVNDTTDFVTVTIRYQCAIGIDDINSLNNISYAFPNPVVSKFHIEYDIKENSDNNKIVLYDLSGKLVKEKIITDKQGIAEIDVTGISAGTYLYALIVNNKTVTTRKIMIDSNK